MYGRRSGEEESRSKCWLWSRTSPALVGITGFSLGGSVGHLNQELELVLVSSQALMNQVNLGKSLPLSGAYDSASVNWRQGVPGQPPKPLQVQ